MRRDRVASTVEVSDAPGGGAALQERQLVEMLAQYGVQVPDVLPVVKYLQYHGDMMDVTLQLAAAVRSAFASPAQLSLEAYTDPEIDNQYLVLYVRQAAYPDDILERIEQAYAPVVDALASVSGWIIATTDFRRA